MKSWILFIFKLNSSSSFKAMLEIKEVSLDIIPNSILLF